MLHQIVKMLLAIYEILLQSCVSKSVLFVYLAEMTAVSFDLRKLFAFLGNSLLDFFWIREYILMTELKSLYLSVYILTRLALCFAYF